MHLWTAAIIVLVLNLPFGYWRANVKRFSLQWALAIHIPVPVVIALRILSGMGFAFITYPVMIAAFFSGQLLGTKMFTWRKRNSKFQPSSCLVCDMLKSIHSVEK